MIDTIAGLIIAAGGASFAYISGTIQAGYAHRRQMERDAIAQQNHAEEVRLGRQWDGQCAQFDRVFPAYKAVLGAARACHAIAQERMVVRAGDGTAERRDERLSQLFNTATTGLEDALLTLGLVDASDVLVLQRRFLWGGAHLSGDKPAGKAHVWFGGNYWPECPFSHLCVAPHPVIQGNGAR